MLVVFLSCSSKLNFVVLLVETLGFSSSDVTEFGESSGEFLFHLLGFSSRFEFTLSTSHSCPALPYFCISALG